MNALGLMEQRQPAGAVRTPTCDSPYALKRVSSAANAPLLSLLLCEDGGKQPPGAALFPLDREAGRDGLGSCRPNTPSRRRDGELSERPRVSSLFREASRAVSAFPRQEHLREDPPQPPTPAPSAHEEESNSGATTTPLDDHTLAEGSDSLPFRQRLREVERRFGEQVAVHRGITAALRDVEGVQREARLLASEKRLSDMLALLRVRQDETFARALAHNAVAPPVVSSSTQQSHPQQLWQRHAVPYGVAAAPGASAEPSTAPTAAPEPSAASPLLSVLEAFAKPRAKTSGIPSPPPLSTAQYPAREASAAGPGGRRGAKSGGSGGMADHRMVDLTPKRPQPYVRVHWVPREAHPAEKTAYTGSPGPSDGSAKTPRGGAHAVVMGGDSGDPLPHVEETGNLDHSVVYDDDFEESIGRSGGSVATTILDDEESLLEEEGDDTSVDRRRRRRRHARGTHWADEGTVLSGSNGTVTTASEEGHGGAAAASSAASSPSAAAAAVHHPRSLSRSIESSYTDGSASLVAAQRKAGRDSSRSGERLLMQTLSALYGACKSANQLAERLTRGEEGHAPAPHPGGEASEVSAAATKELTAAFGDVRRLRRFNERLRRALRTLDLEHRARRARTQLLLEAQTLARARRALTKEEEAVLEDVLPPGVAAKLLAGRAQLYPASKAPRKSRAKAAGHSSEGSTDNNDVLTEMEESDQGFFRQRRSGTHRRRHRGFLQGSIEEEDDDDGVEEEDAVGEVEELIHSDYHDGSELSVSSVSDAITESIGEDISGGGPSSASSIREVDAASEAYSDSFLSSDTENERSGGGVISEEGLDDLEEAVQRAMDEHRVAHVFRRRRQPGTSRRRGEGDGSVSEETASAMESSAVLDEVEEELAERLAASDVTASALLSDTSIAEEIHELESSPRSLSSSSQSAKDVVSSSAAAGAADSPTASATHSSHSSPTPYAASHEGKDASEPTGGRSRGDESTSSLSSLAAHSYSLGEEELQDLEADLNTTRHRRRTALRSVLRPAAPAEHVSSASDGGAVATFTQLYDPEDSTLTSLASEVDNAGLEGVPQPGRRGCGSTSDVLLRVKALTDAAAGGQYKGKHIYFAEPDLLGSRSRRVATAPGLPTKLNDKRSVAVQVSDGGLEEGVAAVGTPDKPEGSNVEGGPRPPVAAAAEEEAEVPSSVAAEEGPPPPPSHSQQQQQEQEPAPERKGALPNLAEDFVALAAWKRRELQLFEELRGVTTDGEGRGGESPLLSDGSGSEEVRHARLEETEGSFAHHWGMLHSLLESRFGRRKGTPVNPLPQRRLLASGGDADSDDGYYYPSMLADQLDDDEDDDYDEDDEEEKAGYLGSDVESEGSCLCADESSGPGTEQDEAPSPMSG